MYDHRYDGVTYIPPDYAQNDLAFRHVTAYVWYGGKLWICNVLCTYDVVTCIDLKAYALYIVDHVSTKK